MPEADLTVQGISQPAGTWDETPLLFECEGERLLGIVARPAQAQACGLLIVVGGPQYRAGSHRQFTLLARQLAATGIASFRFDHRGMGDSEGEPRSFEALDADIRAAVDAFCAQMPGLRSVALWGLCDAAWAIARYGRSDPRIGRLILLNPWVSEPQVEARARLRNYYPQRFGQGHFWARLLAFDIDVRTALRGLVRDLGSAYLGRTGSAGGRRVSLATAMHEGLCGFAGDMTVIASENDLTGQAFCALLGGDPDWHDIRGRARLAVVGDADHTFSHHAWRHEVATITAGAVGRETASPLRGEWIAFAPREAPWLEAEWQTLEAQAPASFFQSWIWMKAWLHALPAGTVLHLLRLRRGPEVVALGVFGKNTETRHGIIRSRKLSLSETGRPEFDAITVEHNNLLLRPNLGPQAWSAALDFLAGEVGGWDEVRLAGLSDEESVQAIRRYRPDRDIRAGIEISKPYFWVDLESLQRQGRDYLSALSANTRQQIRKAIRLYEAEGPIETTVADSPELARALFDELVRLHQAYWNRKGQPGAFASAFSRRFHDGLLADGAHVQLVKFAAAGETIGILYNFVHRRKVYNYQAGLAYTDNPKMKPGLVCHALAIEYNKSIGHAAYDFLMGDSQYKRSLATEQGQMHWLSVKQPRWRFAIEDMARQAKARLRAAQAGTGTDQPQQP